MALRANEEENSKSQVPGVNHFWQEADGPPTYERIRMGIMDSTIRSLHFCKTFNFGLQIDQGR